MLIFDCQGMGQMRHMETTGWCVIVGGTGENKDTSDCKGVKNKNSKCEKVFQGV